MSDMYPELASLRSSLEAGWAAMDTPLVQSQMQALEQAYRDNEPASVTNQLESKLNASIASGGGPLPGGGGGGGGGGNAANQVDPMDEYYKNLERQRRTNQTEVLRGLLDSYGMAGLFERVKSYIQDGYDADAVMVLIRTTPEYKQRFPAMEALARKGRAISEGEYISYEKTAQNLERRYGLPQGMLMNSVTDLLTNEVSAVELNDRVLLASAASIQAPQEIKNMFQQYYGIDAGGMTAYFLDPDIATPLLEKQFASAVIGNEAARQGVGIDVYGAENLQGLGITQEQARQGFGKVAAATGLTAGRGDVVTQQELIGSAFNTNAEAQKSVERAIGGRLGRFQGGGEFLQQGGQNVGLGTAATR